MKEKIRPDTELRGGGGDSTSDSWAKGDRGQGGWGSERGGGGGGGLSRGNFWSPSQPRSFPAASNNSGNDAYSRFNENRLGGRRKMEPESGESHLDRSGWSSASNWAVRRTLPADVQSYYSRKERGPSTGGPWSKPEDEQSAAGITTTTTKIQSVIVCRLVKCVINS